MSEKDNTFKFNPKEINDKPHIERSDADEFTAARRTRHTAEREKDNRPLIYVSIALMIALIAVIVIGIFVLNNSADKGQKPENEEVIDMTTSEEDENEEEEEEEEEVEEKKEVISSWSLIFDPETISRADGKGYKISATFFDNSGKTVFSGRKVYITSKTDIRDNGKRVSAESFIKLLSNQSGDMIFFEGTVNEGSNEVISIKYNSSEFEEESTEEETEEKEEEKEPEKEPEEEKKEETPSEKEEPVEDKPVEEEKKEEPPVEDTQQEEAPSEETPATTPETTPAQ